MDTATEIPTIGEVLLNEFLNPLSISATLLSKEIGVDVALIQDILLDKRKLSPDIALRLSILFEKPDNYFISIQNDIDIKNLRIKKAKELSQIKPLTKRTFSFSLS